MSVSLSVKRRGQSADTALLIPLASHETFRRHWLPASRKLNLIWIPMFETGIPLQPGDVPDIVEELQTLKDWSELNSPEVADVISDSIERALAELRAPRTENEVDIYIG